MVLTFQYPWSETTTGCIVSAGNCICDGVFLTAVPPNPPTCDVLSGCTVMPFVISKILLTQSHSACAHIYIQIITTPNPTINYSPSPTEKRNKNKHMQKNVLMHTLHFIETVTVMFSAAQNSSGDLLPLHILSSQLGRVRPCSHCSCRMLDHCINKKVAVPDSDASVRNCSLLTMCPTTPETCGPSPW